MLKHLFILFLVFIMNSAFALIQVSMKIPANAEAGAVFNVELAFSNVDTKGFARLKQEVPAGFTATAINVEGAKFYFENNTIKLIWANLPEKSNFTISYQLKSDSKIIGESFIGKGQFDFQKESTSEKIEIKAKKINITKPAKSIAEVTKDPKKESTAKTTPIEVKKTETTASNTTKTTGNTNNTSVPKSSTNSAPINTNKTGVVFRIQFQASSAKQNINDLKQKYAIKDAVYEEQVDGMFKYTYGDFKTLESAKSSSSEFKTRTGVLNFVLAFENGKRITVKEALDKINAVK